MKCLVACLTAILLISPCGLHAAETPPAKPNILFIFSDDHAQHAISCYGSKVNQTPNQKPSFSFSSW